MKLDDVIPSYESSFIGNSGPKVEEWNDLPMGDLTMLSYAEEIILFCPPKYQQAIKSDSFYNQIKNRLVVGSNSPLSKDAGQILPIPNRAAEFLKCSQTHLSTRLLKMYLEEGIDGFKKLKINSSLLPRKRKTRNVGNEELSNIVKEFIYLGSLMKIVRAIRDTTDVAASYERIRNARNELLSDLDS